MKVLIPFDGNRVSPVLDSARAFLLVDAGPDGTPIRRRVRIADDDPVGKARRIVGLGATVVICGAVSWSLEAMLASAGMRVVPNTCGLLDDVVNAFYAGSLTEQAFLMPGCPGRQHRRRHRHGRERRNRW